MQLPFLYNPIIPEHERFRWSTIFWIFTQFGSLCAAIANLVASRYHVWGWRTSLGLPLIPSILLLYILAGMDEHPYTLIRRGQLDRARQALRELRGRLDVDAEFIGMARTVSIQRYLNPFREILRMRSVPILVIVFVTTVASKFQGFELFGYYAPFMLQSVGFRVHESYVAPVVGNAILLASQLIGVLIRTCFGRRKVYTFAGVLMILALVCFFCLFNLNMNLLLAPYD